MILRLRELRERRGKSQRDVAHDLGWNTASLSRIESGKQNTKLDVLAMLADYYGVTVRELFAGDDSDRQMDPADRRQETVPQADARILLINPNTSTGITDRLAAAARAVAAPGTVIECVTATAGVPYISTRAEAVIGGMAVLEILAERHGEADAAIVAAFGDPGLGAARELFDIPVIGLAEAGMLTACMLGGRFAIVTFATALGPWYRECVAWHRLEARCAGIRMLDGAFRDIGDVQAEKEALLVDLANRAVAEDEADVVVFAGAPLAGLAGRVRARIAVPVVDCAQAAIKQAEALVALRPRAPQAGSFRRPAAKPSTGLAPALAARIAHR